MMQPDETLQSPSWSPLYETMMMNSTFDDQFVDSYGFTMDDDDDHAGDCGFSAIFNNTTTPSEETTSSSDEVYFTTPFHSSSTNDHMHNNNNIPYTIGEETLHLPSLMDDFDFPIMELDHDFGPTMNMMSTSQGSFQSQNLSSEEAVQEYAYSPTPSLKPELSSIQQTSITIPQENREIQNQVIFPHLIEACGEAMEKGQIPLTEEILRRMSQKVITPLGESSERFAFYFSQDMTNFGEYLRTEALKNFEACFRVFYQGTPHGKFAHFAAISAILEAIPQDCDAIHIVDSFMGLGIQWIPLIEAISNMNRTLKLTSIKRGGDEISEIASTKWNFDETKGKLCGHARSCGLKLTVEEKELEEFVSEIKRMNRRVGEKKVFLAFNCMVGLPHMGKVTSSTRAEAMKFLYLAKDLIKSSCNNNNKGIITFGDGDAFEKLRKSCLDFRSFFEGQLVHYHALLESVESHFPTCFSEARTAMECLFVAPNVSPFAWFEKWDEMKRGDNYCCNIQGEEIGLEGCRFSNDVLLEVREILRGSREGSYQVKIEGQNGNEMVLEWKGTELVRISAWRN